MTQQKTINLVLISLLIGFSLLFGLLAKPAEMGLMIVACSLGLGFANLDQIQRFKGGGFEAEMKKAVEDAYATMESLRAIAKPLVQSMLANLVATGRWGGMDAGEKHRLKEKLDELSGSLDIRDDGHITAALHQFYIYHGIDHIEHLKNVMQTRHITNLAVFNALGTLIDRSVEELPSEAAVRQALFTLSDEESAILEPFVEDYAYYRAHKKLRRPEAIGPL